MQKVSRFAAAMGQGIVASDETDEEKKSRRAKERARKAEESDEDYAKRCAELDEKEKAEDDKPKPGDKDDKDDKGGAAEDDEKCAKARAEGVKAERVRWATVLSDPRCADKGAIAAHLLDETDMTAASIGVALSGVAAATKQTTGLAARMAAEARVVPPSPSEGEGPKAGSAEATAQAIVAAADKARGVKTK